MNSNEHYWYWSEIKDGQSGNHIHSNGDNIFYGRSSCHFALEMWLFFLCRKIEARMIGGMVHEEDTIGRNEGYYVGQCSLSV